MSARSGRSCPSDDGDGAAAWRSLVFGAARHVEGARSGKSASQTAGRCAAMAGRANIGVLQHGVPEAADAAVGRGLGLGKDVDQPIHGCPSDPGAASSPALANAATIAARSIESRITACPMRNWLVDDVELPMAMTTLCMSSIPDEAEATEENCPQ